MNSFHVTISNENRIEYSAFFLLMHIKNKEWNFVKTTGFEHRGNGKQNSLDSHEKKLSHSNFEKSSPSESKLWTEFNTAVQDLMSRPSQS